MKFRLGRRYPVVAAVLVLATAGCDSAPPASSGAAVDLRTASSNCDGTAPTTAPPTTRPPSGETDEIVVATDKDPGASQSRHKLIAAWNKTHVPKARLVELRESTDLVLADLIAAAQNDSPRYDVMLVDIPWVAEFAEEGYIRPLDGRGFKRSDFFAGPWQAGCYNGHLYAVPYTTDVGMLYCRPDLEVQPPHSWAELAGGLPQHPAKIDLTLATQLANYEGLTVNALEAIWSAHGHFVDQDAILDQNARAGLTNMVRAVITGNGAVGSTEFREAGSLNAFNSGKAACMRNWPYANDILLKSPNKTPFKLDPLPWQSVLGGWSLVVSANSPQPKQAVDLIKFLTAPDSEKQLFSDDGLPATRPEVYSDSEVTRDRPYATELSKAIEHAGPRPTTPHYAEVSRALRETVSDLLSADEFDPTVVNAQLDRLETRLRSALVGR